MGEGGKGVRVKGGGEGREGERGKGGREKRERIRADRVERREGEGTRGEVAMARAIK